MFALKDFQGALGAWSFDANGDTTLTNMLFYQGIQGQFKILAVSMANKITVMP